MKRETWVALFLAALIAGILAARHPSGAVPAAPSVSTVAPAVSR